MPDEGDELFKRIKMKRSKKTREKKVFELCEPRTVRTRKHKKRLERIISNEKCEEQRAQTE